VFQLATFRSQGQFTTTVYSDRDRFRVVFGTRMVLFMNRNDIDRLSIAEGDSISLVTDAAAANDGVHQQVEGLIVCAYNIPEGCVVPVSHHADGSKAPAYKGVPVRVLLKAVV